MNIEEILKSRIAPISTTKSNSNVVNGIPPCQNIMFPNPYQYQPAIHVPTRTTAATIGEVGASVDMMRAQLTELSRRMDAVESRFSVFKHSVSNDIYLLKSTLSEHATELLNARDCVEDTLTHVKKTKELIERQDNCVDDLADAVRLQSNQSNRLHKKQQRQKKTVASNVDLGIIRRRLSRVEDFTGEFYEHFESFESVKEIITGLSDHIDECDQDISSFVVKRNEEIIKNCSDGGDTIDATTTMNNYFSNYEDDNVNNYNTNKTNDGNDLVGKEDIYEDDDFEKL